MGCFYEQQMKCDLSGFEVTALDSIVFENGKRISCYLVDQWLQLTKAPACPLTGTYWSDHDLANILSKTAKPTQCQHFLDDFQRNTDAPVEWTSSQLDHLRMSFWTHCIQQIVAETLQDFLSMSELQQQSRLIFYGAMRECPTQTMTDLLHAWRTLRVIDDPESIQASFQMEAYFLRNFIQSIMHESLLKSKEETLHSIESAEAPFSLNANHAHILQALLLSTLHDDVIELLGF